MTTTSNGRTITGPYTTKTGTRPICVTIMQGNTVEHFRFAANNPEGAQQFADTERAS